MSKGNSSKENIFDLSQLVPKSNDVEVQIKQKQKQIEDPEELLKGYVLVPREQWVNLQPNTQIRYMRKDGEMRKGGYLTYVNRTTDVDDKGNDILKFSMLAGNYAAAKRWVVSSASIEKIWRQSNMELMEQHGLNNSEEIKELKESIDYCKRSIDILAQELQRINNENTRIIKLIKKLHKIP